MKTIFHLNEDYILTGASEFAYTSMETDNGIRRVLYKKLGQHTKSAIRGFVDLLMYISDIPELGDIQNN